MTKKRILEKGENPLSGIRRGQYYLMSVTGGSKEKLVFEAGDHPELGSGQKWE